MLNYSTLILHTWLSYYLTRKTMGIGWDSEFPISYSTLLLTKLYKLKTQEQGHSVMLWVGLKSAFTLLTKLYGLGLGLLWPKEQMLFLTSYLINIISLAIPRNYHWLLSLRLLWVVIYLQNKQVIIYFTQLLGGIH